MSVPTFYNSIYAPHEMLPSRKVDLRSAHARKVDREIQATLRQIERPRRKKKPLTARGRESHRKQQARWAKENPDCIADAQKKWRDRQDPELFREYSAKHYALHGEKIKAKRMARYWANRDAINARRRAKLAKLR